MLLVLEPYMRGLNSASCNFLSYSISKIGIILFYFEHFFYFQSILLKYLSITFGHFGACHLTNF